VDAICDMQGRLALKRLDTAVQVNDVPIQRRLREVLDIFAGKVRKLINHYGLNKYGIDPEDVEQEVRIRLWKALERDRHAVFQPAFVKKIVLTTTIDAIRHALARPVEHFADEEESDAIALADGALGPEQRAENLQSLERVETGLAELPQSRRRAVALRWQGYSWNEIATLIGTTSEGARVLSARGLRSLQFGHEF